MAKKNNGGGKKLFFVFLVVFGLIALFVTVFLVQSRQDNRQRASSTTSTQDWYTSEYYDLEVKARPTLYDPGSLGGQWGADVVFEIAGTKVSSLNTLTGVLKEDNTSISQNLTFTKSQSVFTSNSARTLIRGCIDLYSSSSVSQANYLATFCYGMGVLQPGSKNLRVYGPLFVDQPFIELNNYSSEYKGTKPAVVFINSTGFNKNNPNFGSGRPFTRVFYFSTDANIADFKDLKYYINAPVKGDRTPIEVSVCESGANSVQKILRQTRSLYEYINGINTKQYSPTLVGYCQFTYDSQSVFLDGYIGITTPFGFSALQPTSIVTPTPTPQIFKTPTPTPKVLNTVTPFPSKSGPKSAPCGTLGDVYPYNTTRGGVVGDGLITKEDADTILYLIVGKLSVFDSNQVRPRADVNGNGTVTSSDAVQLNSYMKGVTSTFSGCRGSKSR